MINSFNEPMFYYVRCNVHLTVPHKTVNKSSQRRFKKTEIQKTTTGFEEMGANIATSAVKAFCCCHSSGVKTGAR